MAHISKNYNDNLICFNIFYSEYGFKACFKTNPITFDIIPGNHGSTAAALPVMECVVFMGEEEKLSSDFLKKFYKHFQFSSYPIHNLPI